MKCDICEHFAHVVAMDMLLVWVCCFYGHIVGMDILFLWTFVAMDILFLWTCCCYGHIVSMDKLLVLTCCCYGHAVTIRTITPQHVVIQTTLTTWSFEHSGKLLWSHSLLSWCFADHSPEYRYRKIYMKIGIQKIIKWLDEMQFRYV